VKSSDVVNGELFNMDGATEVDPALTRWRC